MGKKIAIGCLSVFLLVVVVGGGFVYFKFLRPAQQAFSAAKQVAQFQELDRGVKLKASYAAPADGVMEAAQVERYLAVHDQLKATLQGKLEELDKRYEEIREGDRQPGFGDLARAWADMANLLVTAKKAQVDALNDSRFSLSEYDWVRGQVLRAAGYSFSQVDLASLGSENGVLQAQDAPVPAENVELVKPIVERLDTALALAAFGL